MAISRRNRNPFPNRTETNSRKTSPEVPSYNCFGWAIAGAEILMGPNRGNGWTWPSIAPFNIRLESLAIVAAEYGYTPCDNGELVDGYEKIVLYGDEERIDHAARQIKNGRWTSKLGYQGEDIEHDTPEVVTGGEYGRVVAFFRRAIDSSQLQIRAAPSHS